MTIRYISTRGGAPAVSFEEAVLQGLAEGGGLYLPERIPAFSAAEITGMQALSYPELAFAVISRFAEGIEPDALKQIIADAYKEFDHPAIAPLKKLDAHTYLLELFHGPTLAFKDFALQFLARLLDHILTARGARAVIVAATSGDTGSAAIAACRGRASMDIFILHPKGRVSEIQRRQMTTVTDRNVHNLAIEGTFDDCQAIVKALFQNNSSPHRGEVRRGALDESSPDKCPHPNPPPKGEGKLLIAVNSINWARIAAQIVYYFYAALQLGAPGKPVSFTVPTGNFGDIYAGYVAKRMGLPIHQLIIATNRNDILARTLKTGEYGMSEVAPTLSPSMDIQVSSNFERLLFDLYDRDGKKIAELMEALKKQKRFTLAPQALSRFKSEFAACAISDEETKKTIAETHRATGELIDPHTAVGLAAGLRARTDPATPLIVLATAHPAKFPEAVRDAAGIMPDLPRPLAGLLKQKENLTILDNNIEAVKKHIEKWV